MYFVFFSSSANPICPTNISMSSDENVTTTDVIWSYPSENRIDLFPLTSNPLNGTTFDLGMTDVTLSLTDFPEYRCTFIVEVKGDYFFYNIFYYDTSVCTLYKKILTNG